MLKKSALYIPIVICLVLFFSYAALGKWEKSRDDDLFGYLRGIYFINEKVGCAVGDRGSETYGAVVITKDGGLSWENVESRATNDLWDVYFVGEKRGWICGGGGVILFSKDGGESWVKQMSVSTVMLQAIFFLDERCGWAVGLNGTIIATEDGGRNWSPLSGGRGAAVVGEGAAGLTDVQFITQKKGWVVGDNGTIKMTEDSGTTWVVQNDPTISGIDSNLACLKFVNETTGWAVGEAGTILSTKDGGSTWTAQNSTVTEWIHGVDFVSESEGFATAEYGTVLHTTDGGETWKVELSGGQPDAKKYKYYDISFPSPKTAFLAAEWGWIMKYTP